MLKFIRQQKFLLYFQLRTAIITISVLQLFYAVFSIYKLSQDSNFDQFDFFLHAGKGLFSLVGLLGVYKDNKLALQCYGLYNVFVLFFLVFGLRFNQIAVPNQSYSTCLISNWFRMIKFCSTDVNFAAFSLAMFYTLIYSLQIHYILSVWSYWNQIKNKCKEEVVPNEVKVVYPQFVFVGESEKCHSAV